MFPFTGPKVAVFKVQVCQIQSWDWDVRVANIFSDNCIGGIVVFPKSGRLWVAACVIRQNMIIAAVLVAPGFGPTFVWFGAESIIVKRTRELLCSVLALDSQHELRICATFLGSSTFLQPFVAIFSEMAQ